jgi:hypothetical protein
VWAGQLSQPIEPGPGTNACYSIHSKHAGLVLEAHARTCFVPGVGPAVGGNLGTRTRVPPSVRPSPVAKRGLPAESHPSHSGWRGGDGDELFVLDNGVLAAVALGAERVLAAGGLPATQTTRRSDSYATRLEARGKIMTLRYLTTEAQRSSESETRVQPSLWSFVQSVCPSTFTARL